METFLFKMFMFLFLTLGMVESRLTAETDGLVNDLFNLYNKIVSPIPGKALNISFGITIVNFLEHEKKTDILNFLILEEMSWNDARLQWDPRDYSGINRLVLPDSLFWLPNIPLRNSLPVSSVFEEKTDAVLLPNGNIIWRPKVLRSVACKHDPRPEYHVCQMIYGSYTFAANLLRLVPIEDKVADSGDDFIHNGLMMGNSSVRLHHQEANETVSAILVEFELFNIFAVMDAEFEMLEDVAENSSNDIYVTSSFVYFLAIILFMKNTCL